MSIFSPNMLKTYNTCPKKYFFQYVEKINVPRLSTPFEKGKKIHALAHYYLQGINITTLESALTPTEREIWQTLLKNPYFRKKCIQSEYQLSCKISDYWIGGRLDAVMQDGSCYYILDYKTGATPDNPQYDYQTMTYLLCLDKFLQNYSKMEFIYINLKQCHNQVIQFNHELKKEYENRIQNICNRINSDTLYKPSCKNCNICEYNNLCSKTL